MSHVDLPDDLVRLAEAQVAAGRVSSIEDVVRLGVTVLERRQLRYEAKMAALRSALEEGERSGIAEDSSLEGVLAEFRSKRPR